MGSCDVTEKFPATKSLDSFDFKAIPKLNKMQVLELARCEWIERRENVIALGPSGTGKTHVALGLGLAACEKGLPVRFITAATLVSELMEARDERRLLRLQKQLASVKLLIIDELGFVPLSKIGAELLFELISQRYARRKLHEVARTGITPIADDGLGRIAALYRIEKDLRGQSPADRQAARQARSKPIVADLETWLTANRARVSAKSPLGEALNYIAKYWGGLIRFLDDGRIELDNNTVERSIRPIALNRKNALFAGHDAGAQNWAVIASLIETCKINSIDPHAWLAHTLTTIVNGHKQSRIAELLPYNYAATV